MSGAPEMRSACASKVVIALTGVLCRGARWGVHLPWVVLYSQLVIPLRSHGVSVEIWAFNNIPPTIDGTPVPADGGKSLYGTLDYYESHKQADIDASAEVGHITTLQGIVGLTRHACASNISRVLFLEGRACERLKRAIQANQLAADAVVYLVSPDLLYLERGLTFPAWDPDRTKLWVMGHLRHTAEREKEGIENGWLAGRAAAIVRFHERRLELTTKARATYYENWLWQLLRHTPVGYIVRPERAMQVHTTARCLRGCASPPPWNWRTTGPVYGEYTWQRLPRDLLLLCVEQFSRFERVPRGLRLADARTWIPLERTLVYLVSAHSFFVAVEEGATLQRIPGFPPHSGYGFLVEWCGGDTVRLRCAHTELFLARGWQTDALTVTRTSGELTNFTCERVKSAQWRENTWSIGHGEYRVGTASPLQSPRMVSTLDPTIVLCPVDGKHIRPSRRSQIRGIMRARWNA